MDSLNTILCHYLECNSPRLRQISIFLSTAPTPAQLQQLCLALPQLRAIKVHIGRATRTSYREENKCENESLDAREVGGQTTGDAGENQSRSIQREKSATGKGACEGSSLWQNLSCDESSQKRTPETQVELRAAQAGQLAPWGAGRLTPAHQGGCKCGPPEAITRYLRLWTQVRDFQWTHHDP